MKIWHPTGKLISLRDVQKYLASRLVTIASNISYIGMTLIEWDSKKAKNIEIVNQWLREIVNECEFIGLPSTKMGAGRLGAALELNLPEHKLAGSLDALHDRFDDEIDGINFFYVKPDKLKWFENTEIAGEQFKANFPKANTELIEAGNCLAVARHTACIFHLMRALEIGLVALEARLGIPRPQHPADKTWGRTLGRISDKIAEKDKSPPANWATERIFFDKARALLAAVKAPLRDDTMHVETTYDEQGAISVFNVCVEALRFLGTGLTEKP